MADRWRLSTVVLLALVHGCAAAALAEQPSTHLSVDDFYSAMLELGSADGRISPEERYTIIEIARRRFSIAEVEEVRRRLSTIESCSGQQGEPPAKPAADAPATAEKPGAPTLLEPIQTAAHPGEVVGGGSGDGAACCDSRPTCLWENLYLTGTLDGFKSPVDFGLNGHFSFNMGVNWGYPLVEQLGVGVQLGSSMNFGSFLVPSFKDATGFEHRQQNFTTVGVFQRTGGLTWALGYDFLFDDYYLDMELGQWRADVGYSVTQADEVGVWATTGDHGDSGEVNFPFATGPVHWEPITQGNFYWRHTWCNGAQTRWWFGIADTESDFVFGGEFRVPLSDKVALIGAANFLVAPDEGSTTASTGLALYPGGGAGRARESRYAPVLPVANNSTFVVDRF